MQQKKPNEIFMQCFKAANQLKSLNETFSFSELVALSAPHPEGLMEDKYVGQTAIELYRSLETLYYPFPTPIKQTTFFQILRENLQDLGFVRSIEDSSKKSQRHYVATHRGRLQMQIATAELAKPSENTTADHALFLINSAILWKTVLSDVRLPIRSTDSFFGFLGMPDTETLLLGMNPEAAVKKLQKVFISNLEKQGLVGEAKDFHNIKHLNDFANKVLTENTTNLAFYKRGLRSYEAFFLNKSKDAQKKPSNPVTDFESSKCIAFAELCKKAHLLISD